MKEYPRVVRPTVGKKPFAQYRKKVVTVEMQFANGKMTVTIPFREICLISENKGFYQRKENILNREERNGQEVWIQIIK